MALSHDIRCRSLALLKRNIAGVSPKVTIHLQGMSFWGPKRVTEELWISGLIPFSIYCIMHGELLGLLLCDSTLTVLYKIYKRNVNKKVQLDATVCRHLFTAKSLYMFRVSQHPSSGVLKTDQATEGSSCTNM